MAALLCLLRGVVWTRPLLRYRVVDICVMTPQIRLVSLLIPRIRTVTRAPRGGRPRLGWVHRQSMPPSRDTNTPLRSTKLTVPT